MNERSNELIKYISMNLCRKDYLKPTYVVSSQCGTTLTFSCLVVGNLPVISAQANAKFLSFVGYSVLIVN